MERRPVGVFVVVAVGVAFFRIAQEVDASVPIRIAIVVVPVALVQLGRWVRNWRRQRPRWWFSYRVNQHGLRDE